MADRPALRAASNVHQAHQLQGKLLLIVGELDRNVDPASTMQVVDALVKADKDFDLLVIPGAGHGAAGTALRETQAAGLFCAAVARSGTAQRLRGIAANQTAGVGA